MATHRVGHPLRVTGATAAIGILLLVILIGGTMAYSPRGGSTSVLAIYQTDHVTDHGNFTVSLEVASTTNIQYVYFTFCQLSSPRCYLPVIMAPHGTNWFVGTTKPMTSYSGMTVGVLAGYNITIVYNDNTNVTEPSIPNAFGNLTIAQSVTGEYMYQMTVSPEVFRLSGVIHDLATGIGISGAQVIVTPGNNMATTTSSAGAYSFPGLPNGTYTISVSERGYRNSSGTVAIAGQSVVKDIAISNATTPPNHDGSPAGGGLPSFLRSMGAIPLLVIVVAVVIVALAAISLSRRRKDGRKPPFSDAPETPGLPPQKPG